MGDRAPVPRRLITDSVDLSADDLERIARPGGQYKGGKIDGIGYEATWYGGAIAHLWRLDPARGERLSREAMHHRPTDWDGLQEVAWFGPQTLATFGTIYVRAHGSEHDSPDALIEQLPRLTHGQNPTYLREPGPQDTRVEYPRYGNRVLVDWHPGRSSPRDPAEGAKTSAEYARRLEAFLAREPRTAADAAAWRDVAISLPFVLHRDPVRALRITLASGQTRFGDRFVIADRIARELDLVPSAARPALAAFVRAYPESFRASLLGFLYVPSVRAAYERELALPYATEWTVDLVGIWPRLTSAQRERLLDLARNPRHMQGASLAVELLNLAPHDARLRPFAEWALRTPASYYHQGVLLTLAANGDPAALARLRHFAGASNPLLAEDATSALADPRLDAVTEPLLRHPAPWVRYQAAIHLASRQDPPGHARLLSLLRDPVALGNGDRGV
ncbi:hypothetical protein EON77_10490, partial [bacterium]